MVDNKKEVNIYRDTPVRYLGKEVFVFIILFIIIEMFAWNYFLTFWRNTFLQIISNYVEYKIKLMFNTKINNMQFAKHNKDEKSILLLYMNYCK